MSGKEIYTKNIRALGISPDKLYISLFLLYYFFLVIFMGRYPYNITPIVIALPTYIVMLTYSKTVKLSKSDCLSFLMLILFCMFANTYLITENAYLIFSIEFYFFLTLPIFYLISTRLIKNGDLLFILRIVRLFLYLQLFTIIAQATKKIFGFGLSIPSDFTKTIDGGYSNMLSGTFYNSNDLAVCVAAIFLMIIYLKPLHDKNITEIYLLCFLIATLMASRTVIVYMVSMYLGDRVLQGGAKKAVFIASTAILTTFILSFYNFGFFEHPIFARLISRIETVIAIFTYGLSVDSSISLRVSSYLNFIDNINNLGLGSGILQDYSIYFSNVGGGLGLFSKNPHSFIIEIGYWLGHPGLLLFSLFLISLAGKNVKRYLIAVISFIVLTLVSSSVISNFMFFFIFFIIFKLARIQVSDNNLYEYKAALLRNKD